MSHLSSSCAAQLLVEARDLMLMSHLQEVIQHADVPTLVPEYESESMGV